METARRSTRSTDFIAKILVDRCTPDPRSATVLFLGVITAAMLHPLVCNILRNVSVGLQVEPAKLPSYRCDPARMTCPQLFVARRWEAFGPRLTDEAACGRVKCHFVPVCQRSSRLATALTSKTRSQAGFVLLVLASFAALAYWHFGLFQRAFISSRRHLQWTAAFDAASCVFSFADFKILFVL